MLLATLKCRERGALQFPVQNFNSSAALLSYFDLYQRQVLVSALTKVAWKFVGMCVPVGSHSPHVLYARELAMRDAHICCRHYSRE
jgi:hypothetical protein